MSGVGVKPSPYQMQNRIWKVGMRPINALVDITNYVMLATGNPTHAFDADNITDHIVVRHAEEGEKLLLLNDHEIDLCEDDLVITDSEGPVALQALWEEPRIPFFRKQSVSSWKLPTLRRQESAVPPFVMITVPKHLPAMKKRSIRNDATRLWRFP